MGVIAEGILRGCRGFFTPVSLGYPLSVFNKKLYSQILSNNFQFLNPLPTTCPWDTHYQFSIKTLLSNKYIHFKTTFKSPRSIMFTGVSWSQALLDNHITITAHHLCRSSCTWRASCVVRKKKTHKKRFKSQELDRPGLHRRISSA